MSAPTLVLGDDTDLAVTLFDENGNAWDVSTASSIKVALARTDRTDLLVTAIAAASGYIGADWTSGVVVVPITGTSTASLTQRLAEIEVQVVLSSRTYTCLGTKQLRLVKGLIT